MGEVWEEEWAKNLADAAIERVKQRVGAKQFQMFDLYVLKEWPVREVAKTLHANSSTTEAVTPLLTHLGYVRWACITPGNRLPSGQIIPAVSTGSVYRSAKDHGLCVDAVIRHQAGQVPRLAGFPNIAHGDQRPESCDDHTHRIVRLLPPARIVSKT